MRDIIEIKFMDINKFGILKNKEFKESDILSLYTGPWRVLDDAFEDPDHQHIGGLPITREFVNNAAVSKGTEILDIGSGRGGVAIYLAENLGCKVTGVEIERERVNDATNVLKTKSLTNQVQFIFSNIETVQFEGEKFDFILGFDSFLHLKKEKIIKNCYRWLKKAGTLTFADFVYEDRVRPKEILPLMKGIASPSMLSIERYIEVLKSEGFQIVDVQNATQEMISYISNTLRRLERIRSIQIEKYGKVNYENIFWGMSQWVSFGSKGKISYYRLICKKIMKI